MAENSAQSIPVKIHPLTVRLFHWVDAIAMILTIKSGWRIYSASPLFSFRVPAKLGFKNPKHIMAMQVTNDYPGGYWEDQGYNWFSGS